MFRELGPIFPQQLGTLATIFAMVGTFIGVGLWLIGARFSRSLITLSLVSIGGWLGLFIPHWMNWNVDGWATAIGLAILLGGSGFVMHRFWVGVGLGAVIAGWAAVAIAVFCKTAETWAFPKVPVGTSFSAYASIAWQSLPNDVGRFLLIAGGTAMLSGLSAALLWPRVGLVMLYSMMGVSLVVGLGSITRDAVPPRWLRAMPAQTSVRAMMIAGLVVLGALLQWKLALSRKQAAPGPKRPIVVDD
jgi:hypothetical protein